MDRAQIFEELKGILKEQLDTDVNAVREETSFKEDLNVDSLDTVEMIMEIEDRLDIKIPDDVAQGFETVKDILDYVEGIKTGVEA